MDNDKDRKLQLLFAEYQLILNQMDHWKQAVIQCRENYER